MPKNLRLSLGDAFFFSIMMGAGETYLPAFGLNQGMGEVVAGWFATLPMIVGALIQMITPWGVAKVGSVRRWVVGATALQAFCFLPLLYISMTPITHHLLLFCIVAVYWGAGYAATPTWNFWIGNLVSEKWSTDFFSWRTRLIQVGTIVGVIGAGLALHSNMHFGPFTSVFSILFLVAFASRASSSFILSRKDDLSSAEKPLNQGISLTSSLLDGFKVAMSSNSRAAFFIFLFLFYLAMTFSSPFVTPFFLKQVHMSYHEYMISVGVFLAAKMLLLPWSGALIRRFGLKNCFLISALGLSPLPAFFLLFQSFWSIQIIQVLSGLFWGMFDVCLALVFFRQLDQKIKISILTTYNLFHATAVAAGSLLGGMVLKFAGETFQGYLQMFSWGALARIAIVLAFWWWIRKGHEIINPETNPRKDKDIALDFSKILH